MCRTVIKNVLVPLVAKYGVETGLWREDYPGYGLVIEDEDFIDFLQESFHEDFKQVGKHCVHMSSAIATIKKTKPAELNIWMDRKLGEYLTLKTVVKERLGERPIVKPAGPRDSYAHLYEILREVSA